MSNRGGQTGRHDQPRSGAAGTSPDPEPGFLEQAVGNAPPQVAAMAKSRKPNFVWSLGGGLHTSGNALVIILIEEGAGPFRLPRLYSSGIPRRTVFGESAATNMNHNEVRRLHTVDLLAIVIAVGCFIYATTSNPGVINRSITDPSLPLVLRLLGILATAVSIACFGSIFPIVLLILWLRPPRARLKELVRKPGFSACLVWTLSIVFLSLAKLSSLLVQLPERLNPVDFGDIARQPVKFCADYLRLHFQSLAYSLAAVWLIQRLGGSWEPESSWIDRSGRAFGFYVIAVMVFAAAIWS